MKGMQGFVIGFSLSLIGVSLTGQLLFSTTISRYTPVAQRNTQIELFKKRSTPQLIPHNAQIFASIHRVAQPITSSSSNTSSTANNIDAPEDDEILNINIDGLIPVEYNNTSPAQHAEITSSEDNDLSAMLPSNLDDNDVFYSNESPWEAVEANNKYVKNKNLIQELNTQRIADTIEDGFTITLEDNSDISYKVAEKIKSSLLFPIPSEILNDENLVPTFIKKPTTTKKEEKKVVPIKNIPTKLSTPQEMDNLTILPKSPVVQKDDESTSKNLLNSITSWFSSPDSKSEEKAIKSTENVEPRTKVTPSYSSQGTNFQRPEQNNNNNNNEFVNFYKTLQETNDAHRNNTIIPSELKLSFQPNRAEISGQTLRWLKAFSEATQDDNTYLQIRLDVSASTELQRKRLNLLYTIFMNNGVDFKKIDTVFSLTEPNAFIIRTLETR